MNQQFGKQVFDQADKLFKDLLVPGNLQVLAEQGVAASKDFYEKDGDRNPRQRESADGDRR